MPLGRAYPCLRQRPRSGEVAWAGAVVSAATPGEMIRKDALSRDVLIKAMSRRTSCLAALDISYLTRRTSLRLFIGRTFLEKFQWRNKHGISYPQDTVHTTNMPKLVGIREVPAIPRDEKVASMKRGCCQVKGITLRIIRHDFVGDVCIHDLGDGLIQVDERQISDQSESRVAVREIPGSQFGIDGQFNRASIGANCTGVRRRATKKPWPGSLPATAFRLGCPTLKEHDFHRESSAPPVAFGCDGPVATGCLPRANARFLRASWRPGAIRRAFWYCTIASSFRPLQNNATP